MKIFIIGLPKSGRSTVAQTLAAHFQGQYIDAMTWVQSSFRPKKEHEHVHHYEDEYDRFLSVRRQANPDLIIDHINNQIAQHPDKDIYVIDGISSPREFANLFDYRKDMVVFLNRTSTEVEYKDHENIGISVIRDYCFWLSSASLLIRDRWLEFNFKIPGEESDFVKEMGSKNRVFIVRSINKVISFIITELSDLFPNIPL